MTVAAPDVIVLAADRLEAARRAVRPIPREALPPLEGVEAAYRVQTLAAQRRVAAGGRRAERKIGLTSEAVRRQLGVDQPSYGLLFADMEVSGVAAIPIARLAQPRIEAEIALIVAADLPGGLSAEEAAAFVDHARVAAEIVDSAIAGWRLGLVEHVADNASAALYALSPVEVPLAAVDWPAAAMRMTRNGQPCSEGRGADCLGGPLEALAWLATAAAARGDPVRAGEVILTGALGPISPIVDADRFRIEIAGLPSLDLAFTGIGS